MLPLDESTRKIEARKEAVAVQLDLILEYVLHVRVVLLLVVACTSYFQGH